MLTQTQPSNPGQTHNPNPTPGTPPATPGTPSVAIVVPQQYLGAPGEVQFQGVALVSALVKLMPNWLHENRPMFDALVQLWRSPQRAGRIRQEEKLNVPQVCLVAISSLQIVVGLWRDTKLICGDYKDR